jgi:hypothetical protein
LRGKNVPRERIKKDVLEGNSEERRLIVMYIAGKGWL